MPDTAQLSAAIHTLTDILQHQKDTGKERLLISPQHLQMLEHLPQHLRQQNAPAPRIAPTAALVSPVVTSAPAATTTIDHNDKKPQLNAIAKAVKTDQKLRALGTLDTTMVFASGNPDARLMLVGEAPGAEEVLAKRPFLGAAGELLDKILNAMKLDRQQIYLSNVLKFRPLKDAQQSKLAASSANRRPNKNEIEASLQYIQAEIDVVQPSVIVALGGTAASSLLGLQIPLKDMRQQNYQFKGIPVIVSYHPAYLIHCESISAEKFKSEKGKVWQDMKFALAKLNHE